MSHNVSEDQGLISVALRALTAEHRRQGSASSKQTAKIVCFSKWSLGGLLVYCLLTLVIAIASICALHQGRVAQQRDYRPFIGFKGLEFGKEKVPTSGEARSSIYVVWANSGKGIPTGLKVETACATVRTFAFQEGTQPRKSFGLLYPSAEFRAPACVLADRGKEDTWEKVIADKKDLFVWGRATYKDEWKAFHLSQFSYRLAAYTGSPMDDSFSIGSIEGTPEHNCADLDCEEFSGYLSNR